MTWFIRITSAKTAAKNTRMSALGTVSPHHTPKRKWVFHMGVPQLFNLMKPKQPFSSDLRKLTPKVTVIATLSPLHTAAPDVKRLPGAGGEASDRWPQGDKTHRGSPALTTSTHDAQEERRIYYMGNFFQKLYYKKQQTSIYSNYLTTDFLDRHYRF